MCRFQRERVDADLRPNPAHPRKKRRLKKIGRSKPPPRRLRKIDFSRRSLTTAGLHSQRYAASGQRQCPRACQTSPFLKERPPLILSSRPLCSTCGAAAERLARLPKLPANCRVCSRTQRCSTRWSSTSRSLHTCSFSWVARQVTRGATVVPAVWTLRPVSGPLLRLGPHGSSYRRRDRGRRGAREVRARGVPDVCALCAAVLLDRLRLAAGALPEEVRLQAEHLRTARRRSHRHRHAHTEEPRAGASAACCLTSQLEPWPWS